MEISNSLHANLHKDRKGSFEVDEKDVYKRQHRPFTYFYGEYQRSTAYNHQSIEYITTHPVSYTHLDVYPRQEQSSQSGSCNQRVPVSSQEFTNHVVSIFREERNKVHRHVKHQKQDKGDTLSLIHIF